MKLLPGPVAEAMPKFGSLVGSPVGQAAQILAIILRQFPRQEAATLMLADVALARYWLGSGDAVVGGAFDTKRYTRDF